MTFDRLPAEYDLRDDKPRIEWYLCDCSCHEGDTHTTPARWLYRYGPAARQAFCTDCMLTRLTEHDDVVPTWYHELRKLYRGG
jgi:hypothetical protein